MNYSEQFVEVHGKRTQVLRGGSGPPLLYLHSAGGEVAWIPFFEQLAERFDVIVPAHPGFAESEGLDQIDSMEDLVLHYTDLMELLALEQPGMVGLSFGGWLAAEFATRYTNLIRALVLIAPVGLRCPTGDIFSASPAETRELVASFTASGIGVQEVLGERPYADGFGWLPNVTLEVGRDWRSGIYLLQISTGIGVKEAPFVVRRAEEGADAASRPPILWVVADATWQAYNATGGK